jgi:hypothetical protein
MRDGRLGVVAHQVPHPALRQLHPGDFVLVLHPYAIAGAFAVGAGAVGVTAGAGLVPVAILAALIAGWSSAWSP